ncbi:hypothetical protein R1sor_021906 [Riccia sorocarpa]|uniref:Uncharacterized protein n=1 Tax=Riccia sorocarpa TaxID=122646 RepID=A0ABD3GLH6_9MARC
MADVVHLERIDLMDEMLARVGEIQRVRNPTIYRPSRSLIPEHSKHYFPRYIALGLYNKEIDVKESACALIDRSKLEIKLDIASVFRTTVNKSWEEICTFVVPNPEEMKRMYDDCPIHDAQAIRNILTLDAVFVTAVLHSLWDVHQSGSLSVRFQGIAKAVQERGLSKGNTGVLLDILAVFQNQIPFELIKTVVRMLYDTEVGLAATAGSLGQNHQTEPQPSNPRVILEVEALSMNGHLKRSSNEFETSEAASVLKGMVEVACGLMMYYLPGPADKPLQTPPLASANYCHLLDCIYRALHQNKETKFDWPEDKDDTLPIATATQLKRAGINIVRGAANISDVKFERGIVGARLILPQLRVTPWTEILLRNLLAYERKVLKKGDLMCYLSFMDQLIDTEKDVLLLKERSHSVIELSHLSSDSEVAKIFNSLLDNSNEIPLACKWTNLRKEIHSFYRSEKRQLWVEFCEVHFGRPWVTASVVAAIGLLVLTFLQTLYTMKTYYDEVCGEYPFKVALSIMSWENIL